MISEEQFQALHKCTITEVNDSSSRFSYKVICSCGTEGLFYSEEDARRYAANHIAVKRLRPY